MTTPSTGPGLAGRRPQRGHRPAHPVGAVENVGKAETTDRRRPVTLALGVAGTGAAQGAGRPERVGAKDAASSVDCFRDGHKPPDAMVADHGQDPTLATPRGRRLRLPAVAVYT